MKNYRSYLLYQMARFGALTVPQILRICEGKCRKSTMYRTLSELVKGDYVYPILNPASRTRAYYATQEGREYILGKHEPLTTGVRTRELDHTILCAEILMELSQYENVTGISTHFEMSADEVKHFCHERIPDGVFRLTQAGQHYELALEVESTVRNMERITHVLERYWQTFKFGMPCSGLLVVAMDATIFGMYSKAIQLRPDEFQARVRLVQGAGLLGIRPEAYGLKVKALSSCLDLIRTTSMGELSYTPMKTNVFLSQTSCQTP